MKKEVIICDCCKLECDTSPGHWEHRPSVFTLKFPRDSINGGIWNMDVCPRCRRILYDAIDGTVKRLRGVEQAVDVNSLEPSEYMPMVDNDVPVFLHPNGLSTERNCAVKLMQMFGAPDWDFRERDKAIFAIGPVIQYEREQMAKQYGGWKETAEQNCRDVAYYQELLDKLGETIGESAYIADDGVLHDSVLRAKVPELVVEMSRQLNEARDLIRQSLGLVYRDGGYFTESDNHDDDVEAMEALRKETEVGRQ